MFAILALFGLSCGDSAILVFGLAFCYILFAIAYHVASVFTPKDPDK